MMMIIVVINHPYVRYLQLHTPKQTMFLQYIHVQCCSCSVFTVCATCNVIPHAKYVLYLYISTSRSVQCPIPLFSVAP